MGVKSPVKIYLGTEKAANSTISNVVFRQHLEITNLCSIDDSGPDVPDPVIHESDDSFHSDNNCLPVEREGIPVESPGYPL